MTRFRRKTGLLSRARRFGGLAVGLAAILIGLLTPSAAMAATSVKFYVDPANDAAVAANALRASNPSAAAELEKIAVHSTAIWLGEWNANQTTVVSTVLNAAWRQDAVPVFVLYAIPDRDCGGFSAGGYATNAEYETFVNQIAAGVKGRTAVFIVEPDA